MDIIIDQTAFNIDYWRRYTEAEFIAMNADTFKQYAQNDRITLLKIAYQKIIA